MKTNSFSDNDKTSANNKKRFTIRIAIIAVLVIVLVALTVYLFTFCASRNTSSLYTVGPIPPEVAALAEGETPPITENSVFLYMYVQEEPQFPGGRDAYRDYIKKNLLYPADAPQDSITRVVIVSFIVEKDGSITNADILKSVSPSHNAEALRLINQMPVWTPGKYDDTVRRVKMYMPVHFLKKM